MANPLRSEAEMFRVVVIVGAAMALVIAVALLAGPLAGGVVLALEALALCVVLVRAVRSEPEDRTPAE